jgi:DNA polymerase V
MGKWFAVLDLKSFYASVECAKRGLDPFKAPLVVCDETRGPGSLVLSVTPYLKTKGCKNIMRKFELPSDIPLIYAKPNMEEYVRKSTEFNALILEYFAPEDWHPYSIDESFIYLTPYLNLYKKTPYELTKFIMAEILNRLGLYATAGVGPNMFLAKVAMDTDAKVAPNRIAIWTKDDIQNRLWKITPITKVWGINKGYERRLASLGLHTMGDVAQYPKALLKEKFGIIGEQIHDHANGIDDSLISETYIPKNPSFTCGQVFHEDYEKHELPMMIREMCDEICYRLRAANFVCSTLSLTAVETKPSNKMHSKSMKLQFPTNDNDILYETFIEILSRFNISAPIRQLHLSASNLTNVRFIQLTLFEDNEKFIKNEALYKAIDEIKNKYGADKIFRADARREKSTYLERIGQIGGHRK